MIIKVSAFLPVVFFGILGNLLLLYVVAINKNLRTPTNMLITNMAVADLMSLLLHPWIFLVYDFFQNYQLGAFGCKTEGGIECALLMSSVMNLLGISYERLSAIVLPDEKRLTPKGAKIFIVITWLLGFIISIPLFIFRRYKERQWSNFLEKYCTEDTIIINIYWHCIITMMVWLPLSVMLICYIAIFVKLDQYEQMVLRKTKINMKYKKKVAKMMFIVVVTFMMCRIPFTALIFYRNQLLKRNYLQKNSQVQNQVNGAYHTLWFVSKYLIFLNSALNPVIYGLSSERFRKAFEKTSISRWFVITEEKTNSKTTLGKNKNGGVADLDKKAKKCNILATLKNKLHKDGNLKCKSMPENFEKDKY